MSGLPERQFNIMPNRSEAELNEVNYRTICINIKYLTFYALACAAIYLSDQAKASGEISEDSSKDVGCQLKGKGPEMSSFASADIISTAAKRSSTKPIIGQ